MIRINQLKLSPGHTEGELRDKIRRMLRLPEGESFCYEIVRQSIDARKKPDIYYSYTVDVRLQKEQSAAKRSRSDQVSVVSPVQYRFPPCGQRRLKHRPIVIGTGPAGLFCGYMLARHGYNPILLERGKDVDSRKKRWTDTGKAAV